MAALAESPAPAWRRLYPFASHFLDLGGHRMHYVDEGPSGEAQGGPLLMVHGNPTWSFYYRQLIQTLAPQRRVLAVDHLGCGLSDKPSPARFDYCLQHHVDNLCQLVDQLDLTNVTLVAHDWGGAIGMGTLLARQDRFARIVLLNTGTFPPPYIPFRIRVCRWPLVGKLALQGGNLFARAAVRMATEQPGGLPRDVAQGLLAPYNSWANRVATYQFVRDIPLSPRHRTWSVLETMERRLSEVADWPISLIWGMRDWCFRPECLERLKAHWPQADVLEIPDAGHYVLEDAPRVVAGRIQEFLERHDRS